MVEKGGGKEKGGKRKKELVWKEDALAESSAPHRALLACQLRALGEQFP